MCNSNEYVTIKVSRKAHTALNRLRHEMYLDTYPQVVDMLINEHLSKEGKSLA